MIVLKQLFLLNSFLCATVSLKLLGIEQCCTVSIVIRLSASQQARPQVGNAS